MQVIRTVAEFRRVRPTISGAVGLVPTMGYLHEGHLSLVRRARAENDVCAAWVFVNPAQFGPHEDFERYPRAEQRDRALLEGEGVDLLFAPSSDEVYPPGFDTAVEVGAVAQRLEGAARPGHFRGVATVVAKFFGIMQPQRAYLGQKDAQQVAVIRRMVADLNLPVEIVVCPTVREADGLALSSRNVYLTPEQRAAAPALYRALGWARERWTEGQRDARVLRALVQDVLDHESLAQVDYVSVADVGTLEELDRLNGPALVSLAVRFGSTRLIDNIVLGG